MGRQCNEKDDVSLELGLNNYNASSEFLWTRDHCFEQLQDRYEVPIVVDGAWRGIREHSMGVQ